MSCIARVIRIAALAGFPLTCTLAFSQEESLPAGLKVTSIEARPAVVELKHKFDYRQLLITGKLQSGETVDLTRMAKASQESSAVSITPDGLVRAKADGGDKLTF